MDVFGSDGERVTEEELVKHWLALEREKTGLDTTALDGMSRREALDELLERKPGAAAFLWRASPIEWSRMTLSRTEFERLRVVGGPEGLLWQALSPDGTVMGAAERVENEDLVVLGAETGVDVERVVAFADELATGGELAELVLTKRRGSGSPRVADGNHRATAVCLHLLRTGEYRPQRAYLGIGKNPVLTPLYERIRGVFSRLRPGGPRW
ncbi:hypothetical protein D3261_03790 [Halococcus sp. IIIV-5B]|nr:hypothetical protein D3261_03790 [Halococcus sp. IIIV-5B]